MKKLLIFLFMLSIVGLFAAVNYNNTKHEGGPIKKQAPEKTEINKPKVNKPEMIDLLTCGEEIQNGIANCYGIDPSYVCCVTATGGYTLYAPYSYVGSFSFQSCGSGCTLICLIPYGIGTTPCCFHINYDFPSGC